AAERAGLKPATICYPGSLPKTASSLYALGGTGFPGTNPQLQVAASGCFSAGIEPDKIQNAKPLALRKPSDWPSLPSSLTPVAEAELAIQPSRPSLKSLSLHLLLARDSAGLPRAILARERHYATRLAECAVGSWSPWAEVEFASIPAFFRFKLVECSSDGSRVRLYHTQFLNPSDLSDPSDIGGQLFAEIGPLQQYVGHNTYSNAWADAATWLEEAEDQLQWMVKAALSLIQKHDRQLVLLKWHFFDHLCHECMGHFDPLSPWYQPETGPEWEGIFRSAHQIADRALGALMGEVDADTSLVVISDHGEHVFTKAVSLNNILANTGYIRCVETPSAPLECIGLPMSAAADGKPLHSRQGVAADAASHKPPVVDWSRTRAFKPQAMYNNLFLNVRGREPGGIVNPGPEYEALRTELIELLRAYRDPQNGRRVFSAVMRREDAAAFGLWGEWAGDIIFFTEPDYVAEWFELTADGAEILPIGPGVKPFRGCNAPAYQSHHGSAFPSADYGLGSERAIFGLWGPDIRRGYVRPHPIRLVDVTPIMCHLLGIAPPAHSEGAVPADVCSAGF
ncbi:MAG: hypothetical protein FJ279_28290, partial [Planctomycetes bacterium]|nr:hypothetical protein [Planctomycetota bacterium]